MSWKLIQLGAGCVLATIGITCIISECSIIGGVLIGSSVVDMLLPNDKGG